MQPTVKRVSIALLFAGIVTENNSMPPPLNWTTAKAQDATALFTARHLELPD